MKYLKLMRVKHYIKNFLIFIPLLFSKQLFNLNLLSNMVMGFVIFSLTASIIYIINDIKDVEKDRKHPVKKNRPIASGSVSLKEAYSLIGILFVGIVLVYLFTSINKYTLNSNFNRTTWCGFLIQ